VAEPEWYRDILKCVEFSAANNVTLIIDDRCDFVLGSGASGVHLGRDDLPVEAARRILGRDLIIGYSTHSIGQVREAEKLPVQYIGFGPVFVTKTKQNPDPVAGMEALRIVCRESSLPVVAVGGIGLSEVREVLQAGACSAAVVSSLMQASDIAGAMENFIEVSMGK